MSKAIHAIVVMLIILIASSASAGQLQITDQRVQCLCSSDDTAFYSWHTNINNFNMCSMRGRMKIDFYGKKGQLLETVYESITLSPKQKQFIEGTTCAHCDVKQVKEIRFSIVNVRSLGR